ncbi:hypothetical protein ACQP08_16355 [Micromonospora zamorensis]|uniref:hypothetical protein n=1 Tax=Micromonospora zamorensis TaxID=709883 RepID=UPI003D8D263B
MLTDQLHRSKPVPQSAPSWSAAANSLAHVARGTLPATEEDRDRYVDQVIRLLTASEAGQERVGP